MEENKMENRNAVMNDNLAVQNDLLNFDFDSLEEQLQGQLEEELADLDFLTEEKEKIENPDSLGKVVLDEVWKQFSNQIGLDITNETLIQKYNREHPESYSEVGQKVMQDPRYKNANRAMKKQQQAGNLKDTYTGKTLNQNDKANLDHVVSRKELFENDRRKQANLSTEDLANKQENLKATNEALNKSKKEKSTEEYLSGREAREKGLKEQNEHKNQKIDKSNFSNAEKQALKDKNNKQLQDKLDADDELMKKADKEARNAINKDIAKGTAKEIGLKAGKDALKMMAVSALFSLAKEIMNGFVRFLKSKAKSFQTFLEEMKQAIKSFFSNISNIISTGASTMIGSIISEIFGPIVSIFKKLASLIKQGVSSLMEAIRYLTDKQNKDKPFSIKVAQVGKIITAGLAAGGAILLGEVFEKILLQIPGMQIEIPLIGSLANVTGMFLASLISGLVGAIAINFIDKFIAKKQRSDATKAQLEKGNNVLNTQHQIRIVAETKLENDKAIAINNIQERHRSAANTMRETLSNIMNNCEENDSLADTIDELNSLLGDLKESL